MLLPRNGLVDIAQGQKQVSLLPVPLQLLDFVKSKSLDVMVELNISSVTTFHPPQRAYHGYLL